MADDKKPKYEKPAGATRVGLPSLDGWWDNEKKSPLHGKLLGEFRQLDAKTKRWRWTAIVGLYAEADATVGKGGDKKSVKLARGQIVGVGVKHKLQDLLMYAPGAEVWILPLKKIPIGGGQTMWEYDFNVIGDPRKKTRDEVELMRTRKPLEAPAAVSDSDPDDSTEDDDIPF